MKTTTATETRDIATRTRTQRTPPRGGRLVSVSTPPKLGRIVMLTGRKAYAVVASDFCLVRNGAFIPHGNIRIWQGFRNAEDAWVFCETFGNSIAYITIEEYLI